MFYINQLCSPQFIISQVAFWKWSWSPAPEAGARGARGQGLHLDSRAVSPDQRLGETFVIPAASWFGDDHLQQGLVNVPFWEYWTSPEKVAIIDIYRPYT